MDMLTTSTWKPANWFGRYFKPLVDTVKFPARFACVLIVLNLFITIPLAAILNIWFDEAYTLNTTGGSIEYALHQAVHFEEQAPLYFIVLSLWRKLNSSIFFARLFSILCTSLTIYTSILISKKLFNGIHPVWAAVALAFNPFMIWAAVEIRLFAFSILLSALALLFFLDGYWDESPRLAARWWHGLVALVALCTHYFLAFSIVAYGVVLLCLRRKMFLTYCRNMLLVGAGFLPLVLYVISSRQLASWSDNPITTSSYIFSFADIIRTSFASTLLYLLPARIGDYSPTAWRMLRFLFLVILIVIGLIYRRSINSNTLVIWSLTFTICTIFLILFTSFGLLGLSNSIQYFRHTISLLIPALFSVLAIFSLIQESYRRRRILSFWIGFMLTLNFASVYLTFSPLAKNGDYIRVASYLVEHESQNQPILVFNPEVEMALNYYYKGSNQLIALPKEEEFETYNIDALTLKNEQEILDALPLDKDFQTIWLVTDTGSIKNKPDYRTSYQILESFMAKDYSVIMDRDFYGSNVKLLQKLQT